jgi:hypothetical protein
MTAEASLYHGVVGIGGPARGRASPGSGAGLPPINRFETELSQPMELLSLRDSATAFTLCSEFLDPTVFHCPQRVCVRACLCVAPSVLVLCVAAPGTHASPLCMRWREPLRFFSYTAKREQPSTAKGSA